MLVLHGNSCVVGDGIVAEASNRAEAGIRGIKRNIVKGSASITAVVGSADILIQVIVGQEQVITVVAGKGKNQGVARGDLPLKLQAEFGISRAVEGLRCGDIIWRQERDPVDR